MDNNQEWRTKQNHFDGVYSRCKRKRNADSSEVAEKKTRYTKEEIKLWLEASMALDHKSGY